MILLHGRARENGKTVIKMGTFLSYAVTGLRNFCSSGVNKGHGSQMLKTKNSDLCISGYLQ